MEQTLLEKADGKRRLEKLVIQKDKFRSILERKSRKEEIQEVEDLLGEEEFENYDPGEGGEVLSETDLKILTDRSETAYVKAEKGEGSGGEAFRTVETKRGEADILGGLGK